MRQALARGDHRWAAACTKALKVRAEKIEKAEVRARTRAWRGALTNSCKRLPHGMPLSRLAYRWVKGVGGWTKGSVGQLASLDRLSQP